MNKCQYMYDKAKKLIPGGTQLLSKRPEMWLPGFWPAYYSKAKGCEIWDLDNNHYYDMSIMGVGANVLGYAFDEVDAVAKEAINNGGMCTLNAPEEVYLAEKLIELHPWADMVRYAKAGGEAMSMATRIARAYTNKDMVLVCGYHGWHDWYLSANLVKGDPLAEVHLRGLDPLGVPRTLAGTNLVFHYNDIEGFNQLIKENEGQIAAVIMEPIRNYFPKDNFLKKIRDITMEKNIVLVFDEITAGFRLCPGGSHMFLGIEPDMAVFAKGMTNGYPLTAVIGRKKIMQAAQETFISSTFWTERIALAATLKSVDYYEKNKVWEHQNNVGKKVKNIWKELSYKNNISIDIFGINPLAHFVFKYENTLAFKTYFTQEMLKEEFLASTGVYASLAHTDEVINKYRKACDIVFGKISNILKHGKNIENELIGPICHASFERLN